MVNSVESLEPLVAHHWLRHLFDFLTSRGLNEDAEALIKDMFQDLFELELSSWIVIDEMWPENITYKMFMEWFSVEFHSMVFDSLKDDIEKDP